MSNRKPEEKEKGTTVKYVVECETHLQSGVVKAGTELRHSEPLFDKLNKLGVLKKK